MCGQCLLVIVWKARMFCHIGLQATTTDFEISSYMICQSYWKLYHWQSEHECGICIQWCSGTLQPRCARCSQSPLSWPMNSQRSIPAWPPRSPHLYPVVFYMCGHVEALVYAAPFGNDSHLTAALWMPVRLSATTWASLNGCGRLWWDESRRALTHGEHVLFQL
jgi:hypothetical protein